MKKIDAKEFIQQIKPELKNFIKEFSEEKMEHSFHEWILIFMDFINNLHAADCQWHKDWHGCDCGAFNIKKD